MEPETRAGRPLMLTVAAGSSRVPATRTVVWRVSRPAAGAVKAMRGAVLSRVRESVRSTLLPAGSAVRRTKVLAPSASGTVREKTPSAWETEAPPARPTVAAGSSTRPVMVTEAAETTAPAAGEVRVSSGATVSSRTVTELSDELPTASAARRTMRLEPSRRVTAAAKSPVGESVAGCSPTSREAAPSTRPETVNCGSLVSRPSTGEMLRKAGGV